MLQAANRALKTSASDGEAGDFFGSSVSLSGNFAIVGAYGDDDNGIDSGSAYIFERAETGWIQRAKLLASDGAAGDYFGHSVSISGNYAIIGAYGDDDQGSNSGSAYVYEKIGETWQQKIKLSAHDGVGGDSFGISVGVSSNYVVVGAYGDDENGYNSGSAYMFQKGMAGWSEATEVAKLTASDGYGVYNLYTPSYDAFGCSVHMNGNRAIIGCCGTRHPGAYIFEQPAGGWSDMTETAKLTPEETDYSLFIRNYGESVFISDEHAIVGADNSSPGANTQSGRVYIYEKPVTGWVDMTETAMFKASDGGSGNGWKNGFGSSVGLSGDVVLVGASLDRESGDYSGSAYVFEKPTDGWVDMSETEKITASDGAPSDYLGSSVSIYGDNSISGVPGDDGNGEKSGSFLSYWMGNFLPAISDIDDQVIYESGSPQIIYFTVSDSETLPENLIVKGKSSNTELVPNGNLVFGGFAVTRSMIISPISGRTGATTISVSVGDGSDTVIDTFSFTVRSLSQRGDINGDGYISLVDVIVGLKILSGDTSSGVSINSDINSDGSIGLEEVLFDLNDIAKED